MKFEIKRDPSKDIEVYSFEIVEAEKPSIWKHWKALGIAALVGCLIAGAGFIWLCQHDLGKLNVELKTDRSTTVVLRSKDEQERNSTGSDGIAPTRY